MTGVLWCIGGFALCGAGFAQEPAPRVALIHGSYGDYRHRDDYDGVMKQLGWPLDKVENRDFAALMERLGDYDLILGTALYNYSNVQDFSVHKEALLGFMDRGGAILWTDTNYAPHVDWLGKWGEDWSVSLASCSSTGTPVGWLDPTHALFAADALVRDLPGTWMHMVPGPGWQVLSRCHDEGATTLLRTHGRGFMVLCSHWPCGISLLRNVWATMACCRAGVLPTFADPGSFTLGDNQVSLGAASLTDQALVAGPVLRWRGPSAPLQSATESAQVDLPLGPREQRTGQLTVPMEDRGTYWFSTALEVDGRVVWEQTRRETRVVIPDLVEVTVVEPRYRGCVMLAAPTPALRAQVSLHPLGEDLTGTVLEAQLRQGGDVCARLAPQPVIGADRGTDAVPGTRTDGSGGLEARPTGVPEGVLSIPLERVEPGAAELRVTLRRPGQDRPLAVATAPVPIVPKREHQVFIDEDLNTRVDGKPFFPIAVYHIPAADFPRARAMGFNSVQAWGTSLPQAQENLDAAQAAGLKVILEGVTYAANEGNLAALDPALEAFASHPALLAWYLTDEPSGEERLAWCKRVYEHLAEQDPHHPVFMTSCSPGEFRRYAWVTDIFAVDPYPIPNSVVMVSDWMQRAQEAVRGRKPVWLIPQLHNWSAYGGHPENGRGPTPQEERNMVYQGLVWGAKAIFYYPWDDGPTGLTHDPALMESVRGINRELEALGPALLRCDHEVTARNQAPDEGLFAAVYRGAEGTYVVAVSVLQEVRALRVPAPGLTDGEVEVLFEGRRAQVANGAISDEFAPLAVHVYRTR